MIVADRTTYSVFEARTSLGIEIDDALEMSEQIDV
jgi:hypothetical protein